MPTGSEMRETNSEFRRLCYHEQRFCYSIRPCCACANWRARNGAWPRKPRGGSSRLLHYFWERMRRVLTPSPVGLFAPVLKSHRKALKRPLSVRFAFLRACATRQWERQLRHDFIVLFDISAARVLSIFKFRCWLPDVTGRSFFNDSHWLLSHQPVSADGKPALTCFVHARSFFSALDAFSLQCVSFFFLQRFLHAFHSVFSI